MKRMGSYCKAYPLAAFRAFDGWHERVENARLEFVDGVSAPRVLDDTSIVFLQEIGSNKMMIDGGAVGGCHLAYYERTVGISMRVSQDEIKYQGECKTPQTHCASPELVQWPRCGCEGRYRKQYPMQTRHGRAH
jgi:hypothetical protein